MPPIGPPPRLPPPPPPPPPPRRPPPAAALAARDRLVRCAGTFAAALEALQDLGRDLGLVGRDLETVDDAVVVAVDPVEEAQGVGDELVARQGAVMVGVGAGEPGGDGVGRAGLGAERLARRADEQLRRGWRGGPPASPSPGGRGRGALPQSPRGPSCGGPEAQAPGTGRRTSGCRWRGGG
jgi:hypothetical protein